MESFIVDIKWLYQDLHKVETSVTQLLVELSHEKDASLSFAVSQSACWYIAKCYACWVFFVLLGETEKTVAQHSDLRLREER